MFNIGDIKNLLTNVSIALDADQLAVCKNQAPNATQILANWYHFSHGNGLTFPFNSSELNAWSSPSTTQLFNTTNSASYIGLVSYDTFSDYYLQADLSSTANDDDAIGLVAAFYKDPKTGYEYTISLMVDCGGFTAASEPTNGIRNAGVSIFYNFGQPSSKRLASFPLISTGGTSEGATSWSRLKTGGAKIRVRVSRVGDVLTFQTTTFYAASETFGDYISTAVYTLDLNSDPSYSIFKGPCRVGISSMSQQNSSWNNFSLVGNSGIIYLLGDKAYLSFSRDSGTWVLNSSSYSFPANTFVYSIYTKTLFWCDAQNNLTQIVPRPTL